jgi:hypothetical protein
LPIDAPRRAEPCEKAQWRILEVKDRDQARHPSVPTGANDGNKVTDLAKHRGAPILMIGSGKRAFVRLLTVPLAIGGSAVVSSVRRGTIRRPRKP